MIRAILVSVLCLILFSCASQPKEMPAKPQVEISKQKNKLPDRPLAFGEEIVFSVDRVEVDVVDLSDSAIISDEECLISQTPNEDGPIDNVVDFMNQAMKTKWIKPHNLNKKYQCDVALQFSAAGCVTDINVTGCKDNIQLVRSIESALFRSAPIPSVGGALAGDRLQFEFFAGP